MTRRRPRVLWLVIVLAGLLLVRTGRAEDEEKPAVSAEQLERAFATLRRAIGERALRDGGLHAVSSEPKAAVRVPPFVFKFSDEELRTFLETERTDVKVAEAGVLTYRDEVKEIIVVRNYGDAGVQFRYARTGGDWNLATLNKWNAEKRLTNSYLDNDNDAILEMDVITRGGLTMDHMRNALRLFDQSVTAFRHHLSETSRAEGK